MLQHHASMDQHHASMDLSQSHPDALKEPPASPMQHYNALASPVSSTPDSSVHGTSLFLQFALQQSSSPVIQRAPPPPPPQPPATRSHESSPQEGRSLHFGQGAPPGGGFLNRTQSYNPEALMRQIQEDRVNAAADALEAFSMPSWDAAQRPANLPPGQRLSRSSYSYP